MGALRLKPSHATNRQHGRYLAATASIFLMASAQPLEAVDLFATRHAAMRPWPGSIFPHTPVISNLHAITAFWNCSLRLVRAARTVEMTVQVSTTI